MITIKIDGVHRSQEYVEAAVELAEADSTHRRNLFHRPWAAKESKRALEKLQDKFDIIAAEEKGAEDATTDR